MPWYEVFPLLVLSHLVGDMLLQTNWQANNKHGGLGSDRESRRALLAHIATYTLSFVPVLIVLADEVGAAGALLTAAAIAGPHMVQDDGRIIAAYMRSVKKIDVDEYPIVSFAVDQTFHLLALLAVALVV